MPKSLVNKFLPFLICGLASLLYVYDYFIQVSPSVIAHELMRDFSISAAGLGILGSCFYYAYTLMQIPAGLLLDKIGARKVMTFSVLITACGVTLFGATNSFLFAGISRFVIGFGVSFSFIGALFLVSQWFKHRYFTLVAGFVQLGGCLGAIFGLAPLALAINNYGWRPVMLFIGLATLIFVFIFWAIIRDKKHHHHQPIPINTEWDRLKLIGKNKQVWWIILCGFISWIPVTSIGALWGTTYLMKLYGLSNTAAGKLCSLFWIGLGIGSPFIGWLSNRIKKRKMPIILCFTIGFFSSIIFIFARQTFIIAIALFLLGSSASIQSLSFGLIKDVVPHKTFGTASGLNNMAAVMGGGITQMLVGFLLALQWGGAILNGVPDYSLNNYRIAFLILPIGMLLGIFTAALKVKETNCIRNERNEKSATLAATLETKP